MKAAPVSRVGWFAHYAKRFCRTRHEDAAQMALWYQILDLFDEVSQ
jgi:hypothetical protein